MKAIIICLSVLVFQACTLSLFDLKKNDKIDVSIRQKIKALDDQLFNGIANDDLRSVNTLLTLELIEKSGNDLLNKMVNTLHAAKIQGYSTFDQYYINTSSVGTTFVLSPENRGKDDYTFKFAAPAKESYVSMLMLNSVGNKMLLTAIYGKYEDAWKISFLRVGEYSLLGKTAQDYYASARENYQRSYLIDAFDDMSTASLCMQPGGPNWQYKQEPEMKKFQDQITKAITSAYHFPIPLADIAGNPEIIRVYPKFEGDGIIPTICYLTKTDLKDTAALRSENKKIQKDIPGIFAGIKLDKKFIFYSAFNELPVDQTKLYHHYGFIEDLAK